VTVLDTPVEKEFNTRLAKALEEFVGIMNGLNLPYPKLIDEAVPRNLKDGVEESMA
jgi:sulfur dioxygenase